MSDGILRTDIRFLENLELPYGPDDESEPFFLNCSPEFWSPLSDDHWKVLLGWIGGIKLGKSCEFLKWDDKRAFNIVKLLKWPHLEAILASNSGYKYLPYFFKYILEAELPALDENRVRLLLRFLVKDNHTMLLPFEFKFSHLVSDFNGLVCNWHGLISELLGVKLLERFIITEKASFVTYLPVDFYTIEETIQFFKEEGVLVDGAHPFTFSSFSLHSAQIYGHLSPMSVKVLFTWFTGGHDVSKLFMSSNWRLKRLKSYLSQFSTSDCCLLFNTEDASLDILAWFFPYFNPETIESVSRCSVVNMDRLLGRFKREITDIDFKNGYYPLKHLRKFSDNWLQCHSASIIPLVYAQMDRFGNQPADSVAENDILNFSELCGKPSMIIEIFLRKRLIILGKAPFRPESFPTYLKALMKSSDPEHIDLLVMWINSLSEDDQKIIFKNIDEECFEWKQKDNLIHLLSHFLNLCDSQIFVSSGLSSKQYLDLFIDVGQGELDKFGFALFSNFPEEWYQLDSNGLHALIFIIGQYYEFMSVPVGVLEMIAKYYHSDGFNGSFASWILLSSALAGTYIAQTVDQMERRKREAFARHSLSEAEKLTGKLSRLIRKIKRRQNRLGMLVTSLPEVYGNWPDATVMPQCLELCRQCRALMWEIDDLCAY
jgi:hypothetical protein